jgi:hypothetical protein
MKHVSCSNNQIPIVFGDPKGEDTAGSFVDAHNPFRFETGSVGGGFTFQERQNDWFSCTDSRSIGKWQMHTITSDGSEFRAFHNGKDYGTQSQSWRNLAGMYISFMGVFPGWGSNGLYGYLDEVIMWDRALTPTEVSAFYEMGKAGKPYKVNL